MTLCQGESDDCMRIATVERDTSGGWLKPTAYCSPCADAYDRWLANYDPPDPDGEDMFRDRAAEQRDAMAAAQRLK